MAGEGGLEPPSADPESAVLPLDDSPESTRQVTIFDTPAQYPLLKKSAPGHPRGLPEALDRLFPAEKDDNLENIGRHGTAGESDPARMDQFACLYLHFVGQGPYRLLHPLPVEIIQAFEHTGKSLETLRYLLAHQMGLYGVIVHIVVVRVEISDVAGRILEKFQP